MDAERGDSRQSEDQQDQQDVGRRDPVDSEGCPPSTAVSARLHALGGDDPLLERPGDEDVQHPHTAADRVDQVPVIKETERLLTVADDLPSVLEQRDIADRHGQEKAELRRQSAGQVDDLVARHLARTTSQSVQCRRDHRRRRGTVEGRFKRKRPIVQVKENGHTGH